MNLCLSLGPSLFHSGTFPEGESIMSHLDPATSLSVNNTRGMRDRNMCWSMRCVRRTLYDKRDDTKTFDPKFLQPTEKVSVCRLTPCPFWSPEQRTRIQESFLTSDLGSGVWGERKGTSRPIDSYIPDSTGNRTVLPTLKRNMTGCWFTTEWRIWVS